MDICVVIFPQDAPNCRIAATIGKDREGLRNPPVKLSFSLLLVSGGGPLLIVVGGTSITRSYFLVADLYARTSP